MSFKATAKFSTGEEFNVINCNYGLFQETNAEGSPSSVTRGGKITLTVESSASTMLRDYMMNSYETRDLKITFNKANSESKLQEVNFKVAYAVKYVQNFDASGKSPLTEQITLSAQKVESGGMEHSNNWVSL